MNLKSNPNIIIIALVKEVSEVIIFNIKFIDLNIYYVEIDFANYTKIIKLYNA